ncbi:hypothetical protein EJB05_39570, partial [Eragrostis curvula]
MAAYNSNFNLALLASAAIASLGITCSGLQFNYPSFDKANKADVSFSPGSGIKDGFLQITPMTGDITDRFGRVCYIRKTLNLWDSRQKHLKSFRTDFVLNIPPLQQNTTGEGMAFILTNNPSVPLNSSGQWLGIANEQTDGSPMNRVVAVEFDTRKSYEEDLDSNHIGLDVNSIKSVAQDPLSNVSISLVNGFDLFVSISYHGEFRLLTVEAMQLTTRGLHVFIQAWPIDLAHHLLEDVYVGFAGSTGEFTELNTELNQIKSWKFITIDGDDSGGGSDRKVTWFLFISLLCACAICAICLRRRSQQRSRLPFDSIEMMKDVPSV